MAAQLKKGAQRSRGIGFVSFSVGQVASESAPVDDPATMRERTLWVARNRFGGVALRGIENDRATCEKDRFPMLKAIAQAQFC